VACADVLLGSDVVINYFEQFLRLVCDELDHGVESMVIEACAESLVLAM
jgi:hypothetical protein